MSFLVLPLLFGLMWLLLIRPQQQRLRRQRALVASVEVGDEVLTAGGMVGRVVAMDGEQVTIEVPPDAVRLTLLRAAINRKLVEEAPAAADPAGGEVGPGQQSTPDRPTDEGVS